MGHRFVGHGHGVKGEEGFNFRWILERKSLQRVNGIFGFVTFELEFDEATTVLRDSNDCSSSHSS